MSTSQIDLNIFNPDKNLSVLIVDDNPYNLFVLEELLKQIPTIR